MKEREKIEGILQKVRQQEISVVDGARLIINYYEEVIRAAESKARNEERRQNMERFSGL